MSAKSPYEGLPPSAFWRSAVRMQDPDALDDLYKPKFDLTPETALMTAGSCFAQHMHRALREAGWNVLQEEGLYPLLPERFCARFGYDIFSARYGNIYTARQFRQLLEEAFSPEPVQAIVWEKQSRFFDALRPGVEPLGLDTPQDVTRARQEHIAAVRRSVEKADCIIFTLGLTEAWEDVATGRILPTAPGTVAGSYDPARAVFRNFGYQDVLDDMLAARDLLRAHGLGARFLLTVSPVPLAATATGGHVAPATIYSKSVLRAVCGHLQQAETDFDYFPSYEIISTPAVGGPYYARNMRDPSDEGVRAVIGVFSLALGAGEGSGGTVRHEDDGESDLHEVQCEEALLDAFRK